MNRRRDNWEQITKVLSKREYTIKSDEYEPIFNQAPDVAETFLFKLYEFLTHKKVDPVFVEADNKNPKAKAG